jgi:hypothetical protein
MMNSNCSKGGSDPVFARWVRGISDGTFGYSSVSIVAVEKAAETLQNPDLAVALSRIKCKPERTKPFIELLETFGPVLIERIVAEKSSRT